MGYSAQAYATHSMNHSYGSSHDGGRMQQPLEYRQPLQPVYRGDEEIDDAEGAVGMAI